MIDLNATVLELDGHDMADLRLVADKARLALAALLAAIHENDPSATYDLAGQVSSALHGMISELHLDARPESEADE